MPMRTKEEQRKYQREWLIQRRQEWIEQNGGKCVKCQSTDSLQIDHINADQKQRNISTLWSMSPTNPVRVNELSKCQILCRNCHLSKTIDNKEHARGYKVGKKMTDDQMREALSLYESGKFTYKELGAMYGVHKDTIRHARNRGWKHLHVPSAVCYNRNL